jgi:hypothetical protein
VPHLGNYLGALVNWVDLQRRVADGSQLLYFLADLHCLTVPSATVNAAQLQDHCRCSMRWVVVFMLRVVTLLMRLPLLWECGVAAGVAAARGSPACHRAL